MPSPIPVIVRQLTFIEVMLDLATMPDAPEDTP